MKVTALIVVHRATCQMKDSISLLGESLRAKGRLEVAHWGPWQESKASPVQRSDWPGYLGDVTRIMQLVWKRVVFKLVVPPTEGGHNKH